jgi:hypothetical protein
LKVFEENQAALIYSSNGKCQEKVFHFLLALLVFLEFKSEMKMIPERLIEGLPQSTLRTDR